MKKVLSLIIALILVFSMFAVSVMAFAEETDTTPPTEAGGEQGEGEGEEEAPKYEHPEVIFHEDVFFEKVFKSHPFTIEMSKNFMLDLDWLKDEELVKSIFEGINYSVLPDEDLEGKETEYTLSYNKGEHAASNVTVAGNKQYKETQHVTLAKAISAEDGYKFAGWKLTIGEQEQDKLYQPEEVISMPASDVTVTAQWVSEDEELEEVIHNDKIYVLYCSPSSDPRDEMKDWSVCAVSSTFSLTTAGYWLFRFAVVDGNAAAESGYSFNYDDVLATTYDNVQKAIDDENPEVDPDKLPNYTLWSYSVDTTNPTAKLSDTMNNKVRDGLTVGTSYSISTSLTIEDCSSTTVTYVVYKKVGNVEGAVDGWIQIYDSKTREVVEGYEDCISTSGSITPLEEDVSEDAVYRIVYSVVDSFGLYAVEEGTDSTEEFHPTMELFVKAKAKTNEEKKIEAWKIVLYVIAGLSAAGIVVLLCIKPKQEVVGDTRVGNAANADENNSEDNNQ